METIKLIEIINTTPSGELNINSLIESINQDSNKPGIIKTEIIETIGAYKGGQFEELNKTICLIRLRHIYEKEIATAKPIDIRKLFYYNI